MSYLTVKIVAPLTDSPPTVVFAWTSQLPWGARLPARSLYIVTPLARGRGIVSRAEDLRGPKTLRASTAG